MKLKLLLILSFFAVSCSTLPTKKELAVSKKSYLFPFGKYEHQISVKIIDGHQNKAIEMSGFIVHKKDIFEGVGLGFMSTTLFSFFIKKSDNIINLSIFHKPLQEKKADFKNYISLIYNLYQTPHTEIPKNNLQLKEPNTDKFLDIELKNYDLNQIPQAIIIKHNKFHIHVKQINYELYEN